MGENFKYILFSIFTIKHVSVVFWYEYCIFRYNVCRISCIFLFFSYILQSKKKKTDLEYCISFQVHRSSWLHSCLLLRGIVIFITWCLSHFLCHYLPGTLHTVFITICVTYLTLLLSLINFYTVYHIYFPTVKLSFISVYPNKGFSKSDCSSM